MKTSDQEECVLCCKEITLYAIGICDHLVCYECSTRMRVLCESNECPICRSSIPLVIFTYEKSSYCSLKDNYTLFDKKYQIKFQNAEAQNAFKLLLENKCKECSEIFYTFGKLKEHVRRVHGLHYCDLCADNLKIFPFEKKYYSRKDLAHHMRLGDPDQTSHRGHPQCEFCDTRYIDLDDLFRHLRKEHYFCHFCDADGKNQFYDNYNYLRTHFRQNHFLCEEENCVNEPFVSAFRSEIDLKAHIAVNHIKNKSKAEARQARTLDLEFSYVPHVRSSGSSSPRSARYRKKNTEENTSASKPEQQDVEDIDTQSMLQFPYLSEGRENAQNQLTSAPTNLSTVVQKKKTPVSVEDFPALVPVTTVSSSSNVAAHKNYSNISKQNIPLRNSAFTKNSNKNVDSVKSTDVKVLDSRTQAPAWILNKKSTHFDEEFPSLGGKKLPQEKPKRVENVPASTSNSSSLNASTSSVPLTNGATDQFVFVKAKSKKKKNKNLAEDTSEENYDASNELLQNKYNLLNEETDFKKNMVRPTINSKNTNTDVDYWFERPSFGNDDFPPLGPSEIVKPPPGFSFSKKKPPPGFSEPDATLNSELSNITLSSIAKKIVVPNKNNEAKQIPISSELFMKPPNFKSRSLQLKQKIQDITVTEEPLNEFMDLCSKFREDNISADEYYTMCLNCLGEKGFMDIFPELLALLPDINKQQQLLHIHKKHQNKQNNSGAIPKNALANSNLLSCEICYQVLVNSDYQSHILYHQS